MVTYSEISRELSQYEESFRPTILQYHLDKYLTELCKLNSDTSLHPIVYATRGGVGMSTDDVNIFMRMCEKIKTKKLDLIIHSGGGSSPAHLVNYLRNKFDYIRAIVPFMAMSAATMLACACDEIVMGNHSALGPVDPQMFILDTGNFKPAHTIIKDYENIEYSIDINPNRTEFWLGKVKGHPTPQECQNAIDLSIRDVSEWLNLYHLDKEKGQKANEIAQWLSDFSEHKTHSRPLNSNLLKDKGLNITKLEDAGNEELQKIILSIYDVILLLFENTPLEQIIYTVKI